MSAELALPPERRSLRLSWAGAARLTLPVIILLTLAAELLLAERKYAIFGGGFGQSRVLDAPLEIGAFLGLILLCHSLILLLLYRLVRRLHRRTTDTPLFHFNFAFFVGGGALAVLIAKFQALAFFSDAMSFQIVRNLGGGSLVDALKYSLSEAGLIVIGLGGAALFYTAIVLLLRKRWRSVPALPDYYRPSRLQWLALLVAAPLLLFAVNRIDDARSAAIRFNGVIAFSTLLHEATDFDRDGWSFYSYPLDRQPFDAGRHPYALDVPGDGIDQDGYGGDFAFSGESAAQAAYSHVGFTTFSLQSLFTGELAPVDDRQSLVRDFLANGYQVGVISGQAEDFGDTARLTGMRRGSLFIDGEMLKEERAFSFAAQGSVNIDGKILLREFDRALGRPEAWQRPRFLYLNLQSAHFPYYEPMMDRILAGEPIPRGEIGGDNRDRVERTYLNAIAYNDRLIGALIARLRRLGQLENTLIVVTADHGESLFDDGFLGHGHMLNDQQTRIPFILSRAGVGMPNVIGLADMRGIILRAAGAAVPTPSQTGVFQYLGTLDHPGAIGLVDAAGRRTVFNLFEETVSTSPGRWAPYADLAEGSIAKRAADALIQEWARQRWLRHLRERG